MLTFAEIAVFAPVTNDRQSTPDVAYGFTALRSESFASELSLTSLAFRI